VCGFYHFSLLLFQEVADEQVKPLVDYERERTLQGVFASPASPRRYSEKQRKSLLEKVDARSYFEKQVSKM
jgi:hypothetical protein